MDNPHIPEKKKIPVPYLPKSLAVGASYSLNDFHPEEVARQLTLIEWKIYYSIQPKECLNKKIFNREELAPNIHKMIERFLILYFFTFSKRKIFFKKDLI